MENWNQSLYTRNISPFMQAGVILVIMIVFMLGSFTLIKMGVGIKPGAPWTMYASCILFFALINSVLSLSAKSSNKYWLHSILSFVCLAIIGGLLAWLISGMSIDEAGSYRWILTIFSFSYLLFLSIVRAMKKIVTMAQKQDKRLRGEE